MSQPLVIKPDGTCLYSFIYGEDAQIPEEDRAIPLQFALVVVMYQEQFVLTFNHFRKAWELPGGVIDPGETSAMCAIRETFEETGQLLTEVQHIGLMKCQLQPDKRWEYGALFKAEITSLAEFVPNQEIEQITLWRHGMELADFDPIDQALIDIALNASAE